MVAQEELDMRSSLCNQDRQIGTRQNSDVAKIPPSVIVSLSFKPPKKA
jgi:hypothetical protein